MNSGSNQEAQNKIIMCVCVCVYKEEPIAYQCCTEAGKLGWVVQPPEYLKEQQTERNGDEGLIKLQQAVTSLFVCLSFCPSSFSHFHCG